MTYLVQVWAFAGYEYQEFAHPFGVYFLSVPVARWQTVYDGPDIAEARICRDVWGLQFPHARLLKRERV